MRLILTILLIGLFKADAQMVINASAPYRPLDVAGSLLLDSFPNAAAAYSLRKLKSSYTGAAIRVRKDTTGQPEQDINFTESGDLDTASLKSFLNATSGFVTTWYDQSGNDRNATQTIQANQPRIALTGVIDRRSGDIALVYDGSNDFLENNTSGFSVNNISHYAVSSRGNNANDLRVVYSTGILDFQSTGFGFFYSLTSAPDNITQNRLYQQIRNTAISLQIIGDYTNTLNSNNLVFGIGTSSIDYIYYNGGDEKTVSHTRSNVTSTARIVLGSRRTNIGGYSFYLNGTISEIVFWNADQTSNKTAIQNNINNYWSIY